MQIYVDGNAVRSGNGQKEYPFQTISEAAKIARPGDEVLVASGVYREYVDPANAGCEDARIVYRSVEPGKAVITGAEIVDNWEHLEGDVWTARVSNGLFGDYNPYTTLVSGDWFIASYTAHTGEVYLNGKSMYEVTSLDKVKKPEIYKKSWDQAFTVYTWYVEQDEEKNETVFYVNFQGKNPNEETVEINVRENCFYPSKEGIGYITLSGFVVKQAATQWAPPTAYQEGMVGPHWSKGWIIEDCEISDSKCSGISLGKYLDPDNNHYFTYKYVKSPTQMERDAVCRGQYHGWLKEKVGSHIIRRNNIHHCEQGGIIGRMGGVFSIIEDNHIHHINNMMELGGAEIAGIKMHAAIDVTMRRNHIHHCTMGIWCDWEAQGTRLSQNLLHDNQRPPFASVLKGGMMSQDIFVEVGHGPTLIDNNIMLSDASLRFATEGVALVHNLICGALTCVGGGTGPRYTPYHMPHRTEVMGFMTVLHGDDRFYNNIFVQKWPSDDIITMHDSDDGFDTENRAAGTWMFDEYPTYDEWISQFDFSKPADMAKLYGAHEGKLPVWIEGNAYLGGAKPSKKDVNALISAVAREDVRVELVQKEDGYYLDTNVYELIEGFKNRMIDSDVLGKAFEPEERFENPDGTAIRFDSDYFGTHRGVDVIPGPFADAKEAVKKLY